MPSTYKLHYFAIKGRAEPIRFLLSYGGLEFEDVRYTFEDWPNFISSTPFRQLPILEVDGKVIHQSIAIERYLAKQVKLTGANDWENLEIDAIVDTISDLLTKVATYRYETDATRKESLRASLLKEVLPFYASRLEAFAEKIMDILHLAEFLTWADLHFVGLLDTCNAYAETNMLVDYPKLCAVKDNVFALPQIKAWLEKRPVTDF